MPVPACWVARADLRKAFSPSAASPVMIVRQVSTGQPGWRKSRWKSPISALPRQPGQTSGKVAAVSTRTATSPARVSSARVSPPFADRGVPPLWNTSPVGATVSARPGAAHWRWSGSRGDQRRCGRCSGVGVPASSSGAIAGAVSSEASDSSASGPSLRVAAPAEASVPSSARRKAESAVSGAGPGGPASEAQTNAR